MRTIALICVAGMSTSMLEMKMDKAAKAQGYACSIHAYPLSDLGKIGDPDIVLLGPQVRFQRATVEEKVHCPVMDISMARYGSMDGEGVLKDVREVLGD